SASFPFLASLQWSSNRFTSPISASSFSRHYYLLITSEAMSTRSSDDSKCSMGEISDDDIEEYIEDFIEGFITSGLVRPQKGTTSRAPTDWPTASDILQFKYNLVSYKVSALEAEA
uniref:Uncharacterized protein n=1 Tax=Oryza glaberrima TaxID=4538 RepID=I1PJT2_ORYGL